MAVPRASEISWRLLILFTLVHLLCFGALWTGISAGAAALGIALYALRMFGVTAGYHRLYSHRSYHIPNPLLRGVMWFLATSSAQRGVRWWAAHHRHHHRFSDQPEDLHSPRHIGVYSHVGWQYHKDLDTWDERSLTDFAKAFPELSWLDRFAWASPIALMALCIAAFGWEGLFVSFAMSTVGVWHATFTINSLSHVWGTRPFETDDTSRNNALLALVSFGEGWHNNHHAFPVSCRQGHTWWQVDISWMVLRVGELLGLVTDVRRPPARAMAHWGGGDAAESPQA
jgi:stearoyl-CoA desaturase (delta-9 desaturase)